MPATMSAALPLIILGLVLLVVAVWLLSRAGRKAKVIEDGSAAPLARDVLDEGAARAQRNQALIDAAPAAVKTTPEPVAAPAPTPAPAPVPAPEPVAETPAPAPTPAAELGAEAAPEVAHAPAAVTASGTASADDLARIKGVGPKLVALLGELGITAYAQIAGWSDADVERIDAQLGRFKGRITRDQWIEQAKLLAEGDEATFTDKFGRNG